ncbi:mammalian cell entry protein [Mycobacterium intermedium]|uniref:Mammalian cell entry protein n=1 Tax=Mycobacterium intermedium TaxID=28445 RepID=A0A1E3SKR8_MYCIE|nr:mammalian cell entry protein [Mycobacterium intermedium]MCV6962811.1 mammalian cell entry protein [Mycobacterium intermedium]ODR02712.1 mammalian cell entry protein [Mycobacterium intermedium]OPE50642.1 mammalian cell entry protein [Mycobacterium intermedium]ORB09977.1 mammalian cell entry protein [Mycobacterium intermedium]
MFGKRRSAGAAQEDASDGKVESEESPTADAGTDSTEAVTAPGDAAEVEAAEGVTAEETDTVETGADDPAEAGEGETETAETETDTDTDAAEAGEVGEAAEASEATTSEKQVRRRRLGGKRLAVAAAIVMSLLFVGSAAFAGASVQPYLADKATVAIKLKVARTAANAITTLWTYTPENMDSLADRAANYLSGDFGAQYRKFVDSIVAPNKQAKVTNSTEVTGVAVESLNRDDAVAIVYTNTTTTSPLTKNIPSLKYLSYRLIMRRDHDRWLVTRMTTITSLDLTPRL